MSTRKALVSSGILGVAVVAGCGSAAESSVPSGTSVAATTRPSTAPTATVRATPSIDLAAVIFGPDEAPPGMAHDETVTGPLTLTMVIESGRQAEFARLDGFIDGRTTTFSGDAGALLTGALAFDSDIAADMAAHEYQGELTAPGGYGFEVTGRNTIAFESLCATGDRRSFPGLIEHICVWHSGPIVFLVGGPMSEADILAISTELASRVDASR